MIAANEYLVHAVSSLYNLSKCEISMINHPCFGAVLLGCCSMPPGQATEQLRPACLSHTEDNPRSGLSLDRSNHCCTSEGTSVRPRYMFFERRPHDELMTMGLSYSPSLSCCLPESISSFCKIDSLTLQLRCHTDAMGANLIRCEVSPSKAL